MELNQFLLIAGGLLVVSLFLLIGGISLYRSRREEEAAETKNTALVPPAAAARPDEPGESAVSAADAAPRRAHAPADNAGRTPDPRMAVEAPGSPNAAPADGKGNALAAGTNPTPDPAAVPGPMLKGPVSGAPQMAPRAIPEKSPAAPEGMVEILRVYRDPFDAQLSMKVLGQAAEGVDEMSAARLAQLKRVIREIAEWVENVPDPAPGEIAASVAAETPAVYAPEEPAPWDAEEVPAPAEPVLIKPTETFADTLPQQPEIRDLLFRRRKPKAEEEEAPEPPKSIAEQIDGIVQSLLPGSPLSGQQIRLSEVPGGGLLIVHNGQRYQGIDEVEDPAAHALIKKAVQVWNERNRLG